MLRNIQPEQFNSVYYSQFPNLANIGAMTKKILMTTQPQNFINQNVTGSLRYVESSGTSGKRAFGWYNQSDFHRMAQYIINDGICLMEKDTILVRFPYAMCFPPFLIEQACSEVGAKIIPASGRTEITPYFKVVDLMHNLSVTILACNPREAELLYESVAIQGKKVSDYFPSLRAILVAGELVSPSRKEYLEKIWKVPLFNIYGATEVGNFAYTCAKGHLHFDDENYLAECLNEDGAFTEFQSGKVSEAYLTTLSNKVAPHIRFELGDLIQLQDSDCLCGSKNRLIVPYGRASDSICIGNKRYNFYEIQEIIYSLSVVPFGWFFKEQDKRALLQLEYNVNQLLNKDEIERVIYIEFACQNEALQIEMYDESTLFDRSSIFSYPKSKKPRYIVKNLEIRLEELLKDGKASLDSGNIKNAIKYFREIIQSAPESSEGYLWLAAALGIEMDNASFIEKMKLFPSLSSATDKTLHLDKYSPFGNYIKGILLMKTPSELGGNKSEALRYLRLSRYLGYSSSDLIEKIQDLVNDFEIGEG